METCADCGKPIKMGEPSYYRKDPAGDIGKAFHSTCGDPFGLKAKDAKIARLTEVLEWLDRLGGLGFDAHERIRRALSQ